MQATGHSTGAAYSLPRLSHFRDHILNQSGFQCARGQSTGYAIRVQTLTQGQQFVLGDARTDLACHRIENLREQCDMSALRATGTVADPWPVCRGEERVPQLIAPCHRQFVIEQQCLMARPYLSVPVQVGHDFSRCVVPLQYSSGLWLSKQRIRYRTVHHVSAKLRQFPTINHFGRPGSWLGELSGNGTHNATHAGNRWSSDVRSAIGRLIEQCHLAAHMCGCPLRRVLGTVACL
jgi:hypothetical protein